MAYVHGMSKTRIYRIWKHIKERTDSPACKEYPHYGGRGIIMCPAWRKSFGLFLTDVGVGSSHLEIDRIDNNGPYCPFNVRWADHFQQANNARSNRKIEFRGQVHGICEWSRILGIPRTTLRARLDRLGWPVELTFSTPRRLHGVGPFNMT